MRLPDGPPAETDLSRPGAARVHDHVLGGGHHVERDRQLGAVGRNDGRAD
ncbi:hypothetical protein [Plantactinospora sp. B5E13]